MDICVCVYIYIHTHTHNLIKPEFSLTKIIFGCHDFCMELTFHTSSVNHLLHIG